MTEPLRVSGGLKFGEIGRFENRVEIGMHPVAQARSRGRSLLVGPAFHRHLATVETSTWERLAMSWKKIYEIEGGEEEPGRNAGFQTGQFSRLSERR